MTGMSILKTKKSIFIVILIGVCIVVGFSWGGYSKQPSVLFQKKVVVLGDSITYQNIWQPLVESELGGSWVNCGVGSTPLGGENHTNAFWRKERLEDVKSNNPDILIIFGGANDLILNPEIGTSNNLEDKNTNTFIGAYSYIIDNLLTWKPGLQIIIVSTTWAHNDGKDYSKTVTYGDFAKACELVSQYYHLPYVDLYNESGFNQYTVGDPPNNIYSEDHIHPNAVGAKVIASMISAKLIEINRMQ